MKCDSCDLESDWDQAFRLTRKSFSLQKARNLCPSCWSIRQAADWRLCVYFSLALAAVTILPAVIILGPRGQIGRLLFWGYVLLFVPCVTMLRIGACRHGRYARAAAVCNRLRTVGPRALPRSYPEMGFRDQKLALRRICPHGRSFRTLDPASLVVDGAGRPPVQRRLGCPVPHGRTPHRALRLCFNHSRGRI